jgi:hypothetical protein
MLYENLAEAGAAGSIRLAARPAAPRNRIIRIFLQADVSPDATANRATSLRYVVLQQVAYTSMRSNSFRDYLKPPGENEAPDRRPSYRFAQSADSHQPKLEQGTRYLESRPDPCRPRIHCESPTAARDIDVFCAAMPGRAWRVARSCEARCAVSIAGRAQFARSCPASRGRSAIPPSRW